MLLLRILLVDLHPGNLLNTPVIQIPWQNSAAHGQRCYANFFHSILFPVFQPHPYSIYLLDITLIFGRSLCSLTAETPVKYECNSKDVTVNSAKYLKFLKGSFSNSNPWSCTPSPKRNNQQGVSSGWSSTSFHSNTGLSSAQDEQIPIILGVWPFWLTPFFSRSITFWQVYG